MSSLKTTVSIEGELVDLAEVFKALAAAAAATPRPEPRITGEHLAYTPSEIPIHKEFLKAESPEPRAAYEDSGRVAVLSSSEGVTDEPETQEQSGKRKRRTKAEIEADRLAAEQAAIEQANRPVDEVAAADEAVNDFEAGITAVTQSEEPVSTDAPGDFNALMDRIEAVQANLNHTELAPEPTPIPNATEPVASVEVAQSNTSQANLTAPAPAPQPNTTSATVDGTSPFIAELRAFCQQKMLGKPENQVLIKNLLTEFGAAGLSALKEVDKMAFKQRLEALPFK